MTMRILALALGLLTVLLTGAHAEGREKIGVGRLFSNDSIVDGRDRWRTGAYSLSWVRGYGWEGKRPETFGDILEYRLHSEIISSRNISFPPPAPDDRPYVGLLSFGVHSHWQQRGIDFSLGGGVIATGPQTGMAALQDGFHSLMGFPRLGDMSGAIPNAIYPRATFEVSRQFAIGHGPFLRPFVELDAGAEVLARAGFDLFHSAKLSNQLLLRDETTGQLYTGTRRDVQTGTSFVIGADVAHVAHSEYLPSDLGYRVEPTRVRARIGLHYQGATASGFAGVTYLAPEFKGQPEGQLVGSVRLMLRF